MARIQTDRIQNWRVQAEALVKKNDFASLAEYNDLSTNIAIVLSGIDQQTKTFTEPPNQIKKEINSIKANKAIRHETPTTTG
jgi:hypothetical protein